MRYSFCVIMLLFSAYCLGQNTSIRKAKKFIAHANTCETTHISPNDERFKTFKDKDSGYIAIEGKNIYRLLEWKSVTMYNYGIINIDGTDMPPEKVNDLRNEIISLFYSGTSFAELIQKFSIDKDPETANLIRGHLGLYEPFAKALTQHKKGDIFFYEDPKNDPDIINDSDRQLYTVAILNEEPYLIKVAYVVKYVYP